MNKCLGTNAIAILSVTIFANVAAAQPQAQPDKIPVKLQVVISTFEGDRKVSSMPYTLLATANGSEVSFNSNSNVPIQTVTGGPVTYTNLGTQLRCTVTTEAGSFKISINFSDKSVISSKVPAVAANAPTRPLDSPSFHDVSYNSAINMKDGETKQLISAPDKVTGEVVKIDVTLTVETPRRGSIESDNKLLEVATIAIPLSLN